MNAFIPVKLFAIAQDGKRKRILYVDVKNHYGSLFIDQYYQRNMAVHARISELELNAIPKARVSENSCDLYQEVFAE